MKTSNANPSLPFIHRPLAVDITIGDYKWLQLPISISKNINAYLNKEPKPDSLCRVIPTPCLGKHTCLPQGKKRSQLLFSRMNNKSSHKLTFLQISFLTSCGIGSVLKNDFYSKLQVNLLHHDD